jgi:serine/threonine-protein kinase
MSQLFFELKPGLVLGGRYELSEFLGKGAFGSVYRAHDRELDMDCAVKLLSPHWTADSEHVRRFKAEIKIGRKIRHENVCQIYDFGEFKEVKFISMELVDGRNLTARLQETPPLGLAEGIDLVRQICAGLEAAHRVGVVHRDLKSDNVMIDRSGRVKIMDFGIARAGDMTRLTATDKILGTTQYMPPEQWRGEEVDARADLYALGVLMYLVFTGRPPFQGENHVALFYQHLNQPPPAVLSLRPELPAALGRLIESCVAKDREQRPRSAEAIARELAAIPLRDEEGRLALRDPKALEAAARGERASDHGTLVPLSLDTRRLGRPRTGRRPILIVAGLLAALAGGAAAGFGLLPSWLESEDSPGPAESLAAPTPGQTRPPAPRAPTSSALEAESEPAGIETPIPEPTQTSAEPSPQRPSTPAARPRSRESPSAKPSPDFEPTPKQASSPEPPAVSARGRPDPTQPPASTPAAKGLVKFRLNSWASVRVDGRDYGTTPLRPLELAPGPHQIRLENSETEARIDRTVEVRPGQTVTVEADLLYGTLDIDPQPRSEARLKLPDGSIQELGLTPVSAQLPGGRDVQLLLRFDGQERAIIVRIPAGAHQRFQRNLLEDP